MPMLDAYIPEGALSPEAEDRLQADSGQPPALGQGHL